MSPSYTSWLFDYGLASTALLSGALLAMYCLAQPVHRLIIARGTAAGLIALAVVCAHPTLAKHVVGARAFRHLRRFFRENLGSLSVSGQVWMALHQLRRSEVMLDLTRYWRPPILMPIPLVSLQFPRRQAELRSRRHSRASWTGAESCNLSTCWVHSASVSGCWLVQLR